MSTDTVLEYIAANPGCTAVEAGTTPVEMIQREKKGQVIRIGTRSTGKRGRPPVEWAIAGADVTVEPKVAAATAAAKQRVEDHREYERDYTALSTLRQREGLRSEAALKAKAEFKAKWPQPPVLPSAADYAAIGIVNDEKFVKAA